MSEAMPILAAIRCSKEVPVDSLFCDVARAARSSGVRVAGVIQQALPDGASECGGLVLRDLVDGRATPITENRGAAATGCKLDPRGLAEVAARLEAALDAEPDLLIISRFGKAEAEGCGFRSAFGAAMLRGIHVLTAVRETNWADWELFHGGLGVELQPDTSSLQGWLEAFSSALASSLADDRVAAVRLSD